MPRAAAVTLSLAFALSALADASPPAFREPLRQANLAGTEFRLAGCQLQTVGDDRRWSVFGGNTPASACQFAQGSNGRVQALHQDDRHVTLIVAPVQREGSRWCDTAVRALVVEPGRWFVSRDVQKVRSCSIGPFDDQLLQVLSQHPVAAELATN